MAQQTDSAGKPAQQQHLGRMGCLVFLGVLLLVVVGTVFAPDRALQEAAPPTLSATSTSVRTQTRVVTRTVTVTPTRTPSSERTAVLPSGTPVPARVTQVATDLPSATAAEATDSPALTVSPTRTPTASLAAPLLFATNTPFPLLIMTNTPVTDED